MENREPSLTKLDDPKSADNITSAPFKHTVTPETTTTEAMLVPSIANDNAGKNEELMATDNKKRPLLAKLFIKEQKRTPKKEPDSLKTSDKAIGQNWISSLLIVLCIYLLILSSGLSPHIIGLRLAAISTIAESLSPVNYVETKTDYADYLRSIKQYGQSASIYSSVIKKIKTTNMDKQLLSLVDLKLAEVILNTEPSNATQTKSQQARKIIDEAMENLGNPTPNTPRQLVETLVRLGRYYINQDDPYSAYPLLLAASPFWKTGHPSESEGNAFADLGYNFREKHDWPLAYKCFERAFSTTNKWGDGDYNVYRLCEMGLAKANMDEPQAAIDLFKSAIAMDQRIHKGGLDWGANYLTTYLDSLIKMKQLDEASAILTKFSSQINASDYYDDSTKLAQAYAQNNDLNKARGILGNILKDTRLNTAANASAVKTILAKLENNQDKNSKTKIPPSKQKGK